jgi:hypothetical protein
LLGWAAGEGRYKKWSPKAFEMFHTGKVRFSNALPLTPDFRAAYPMPQLLMERKHARGGIGGGKLAPHQVRVGRPANPNESERDEQYETLGRAGFVTPGGNVVQVNSGNRLRTAIREGRAAQGQLFGYVHLEPVHSATKTEPVRYAATIEADAGVLTDHEWRDLCDAFADKWIRLGQASGTYYGGNYHCVLKHDTNAKLWPDGNVTRGDTRVRVWALSDLALMDDFGAPCFAPAPKMFGLPEADQAGTAATFDGSDSAISTRRYSPWNRALDRGGKGNGSRDVERQVIAAGSVVTFNYREGIGMAGGPNIVGLWREAGLGRIWANPTLLRRQPGEVLRDENLQGSQPVWTGDLPNPSEPDIATIEIERDPLVQWLNAISGTPVAKAPEGIHP